jgi:hypothetical protein
MEYRVLLVKDIFLDNIRYSPIKKSLNDNRYSYITYLNGEDEIQNIVVQCKQMNILEMYKNEKGHYHITFQLSSYMKSFLESFEEKVKSDILQFKNNSDLNFRTSVNEENSVFTFKCKIGHIGNLVVFDQYKKLYDEESEIIKLLKNENQMVIPIIECLGLWISNENEAGLTWICHHLKVIQSSTLFRKYLFIDEDDLDNIAGNSSEDTMDSFRRWKKNLPEKNVETSS